MTPFSKKYRKNFLYFTGSDLDPEKIEKIDDRFDRQSSEIAKSHFKKYKKEN